jgi:hypothetical protein
VNKGNEIAHFLASLPDIQSAIRIAGHKNGMRITLEIPQSEMGEAVKLQLWQERILRITVEPEDDGKSKNVGKYRF